MGDTGDGKSNGSGRSSVTFTVPLRITVEIDGTGQQPAIMATSASSSPVAAPSMVVAGTPPPATCSGEGTADKERTLAAVRKARTLLANREDVVAIKPGYRFENGEITDQRAVDIAVRRKVEKGALESRGVMPLPSYIDGVRTDVTVASTADQVDQGGADEAATPSWHTSYVARPDLPLKRRKAKMKFVIHSGPDASWPQLGSFLAKTRKSLRSEEHTSELQSL